MTPLQTNLYFREWGKVREHYRARGLDPKLCDAKRHELHKKALGEMKSSKAFKNADLDKVLAVFYAITRPADLNAQLKQINQEGDRLFEKKKACLNLVLQMPKVASGKDPQNHAKNYLNDIARSHTGNALAMVDEDQLNRIHGILVDRLARALRQPEQVVAKAAATADRITDPKDDPF